MMAMQVKLCAFVLKQTALKLENLQNIPHIHVLDHPREQHEVDKKHKSGTWYFQARSDDCGAGIHPLRAVHVSHVMHHSDRMEA